MNKGKQTAQECTTKTVGFGGVRRARKGAWIDPMLEMGLRRALLKNSHRSGAVSEVGDEARAAVEEFAEHLGCWVLKELQE